MEETIQAHAPLKRKYIWTGSLGLIALAGVVFMMYRSGGDSGAGSGGSLKYEAMLRDARGGDAAGLVNAEYTNNVYRLVGAFGNLQDPPAGQYYEAWIVRENPRDVVSTGRVIRIENIYSNVFTALNDLSDHTGYMLTLEKEPEDSEPGEKLLEGGLLKK